jgi:AsmA protein
MQRKLIWVVGAIVALVLLIAIILPSFIDANRYRPEIQSRLSQSLGRDVKIGELKLSLFSGGVSADQLSIADDPAFGQQPFVTAKSLKVGVEMMPLLFHQQVRVQSLTLDQPVVRLLQSANGKWNFSTLGSKQKSSANGSAPSDLQVQKLEITNGQLEVGTPKKTQAYTDVAVKASNLSYTSSFPYEFSAKTPGDGKIKVKGNAGPIDQADASHTPFTGDVDISNLDLASTGFMGSDSGLAGTLDFKGKISSDGHKLTSDGTATTSKLRLVKNGSAAAQPVQIDYHSQYDLTRDAGTIDKTNINVGKSTAHLGGTYASHGSNTDVDLKFTGEGLQVHDIEGLLPALGITLPSGSSLQSGTVAANLNLRGPVDQLVTDGNVDLSNAKLSGFSLGKSLSSVAALTGLPAGSDTTIQTLASNLRIGPQGTRVDNLNLIVAELGAITGNGTISPQGALDLHLVAKLANGGGVLGALTQVAGAKTGLKNIPIAVKGTTAKPVFVPDLNSAVAQSATGAIPGLDKSSPQQQAIGGILGGLLGGKKKK